MRPVTVTVSSATTSSPIVMDYMEVPFNVGVGCVVTGTATYTVEHTFADPFAAGGLSGATWIANTGLTGKTATADGNYAFPVRAIRLNVAATTGSVTMTVLQGVAP